MWTILYSNILVNTSRGQFKILQLEQILPWILHVEDIAHDQYIVSLNTILLKLYYNIIN